MRISRKSLRTEEATRSDDWIRTRKETTMRVFVAAICCLLLSISQAGCNLLQVEAGDKNIGWPFELAFESRIPRPLGLGRLGASSSIFGGQRQSAEEQLPTTTRELAAILAANLRPENKFVGLQESDGPKLAYLVADPQQDSDNINNEVETADNTQTLVGPFVGSKQLMEYLRGAGNADSEDTSGSQVDSSQYKPLLPPVNDPSEFEFVEFQQRSEPQLNQQLRRVLDPNEDFRGLSGIDSRLNDSRLMLAMSRLQQALRNEDESSNNEGDNESNGLNLADDPRATPSSASKSPSAYGNSEYIDHPLALIGHQYVQGGAGEGRQLLGPDGTFENVQVVKSDRAVPSYCDPPNPCPIGYTSKDGCLEQFVNSASFSREYQAKQHCACDNEHSLFNCASPIQSMKSPSTSPTPTTSGNRIDIEAETENPDGSQQQQQEDNSWSYFPSLSSLGGKLETLARTIHNRFGNMASLQNLIVNHEKNLESQQQQQQSPPEDQYSGYSMAHWG